MKEHSTGELAAKRLAAQERRFEERQPDDTLITMEQLARRAQHEAMARR